VRGTISRVDATLIFHGKMSAHVRAMGGGPAGARGLCLVNAGPLASIATSGGEGFLVPSVNYFTSNKNHKQQTTGSTRTRRRPWSRTWR
jgi:hypothetical protein